MVWQVQASPLPFDTYYEELLRYYRREGHIRVPGNYIVPENGCKLGKFIQRMRAIRAGTASSGFYHPEQIAKLDAMGMVLECIKFKKNLEERSCRNGYFHLVDREEIAHSKRTAEISRILAEHADYDSAEVHEVYRGGIASRYLENNDPGAHPL
ncbi:MAG: helicase associated domain-containing protein [Subdoligranulum sp.]